MPKASLNNLGRLHTLRVERGPPAGQGAAYPWATSRWERVSLALCDHGGAHFDDDHGTVDALSWSITMAMSLPPCSSTSRNEKRRSMSATCPEFRRPSPSAVVEGHTTRAPSSKLPSIPRPRGHRSTDPPRAKALHAMRPLPNQPSPQSRSTSSEPTSGAPTRPDQGGMPGILSGPDGTSEAQISSVFVALSGRPAVATMCLPAGGAGSIPVRHSPRARTVSVSSP